MDDGLSTQILYSAIDPDEATPQVPETALDPPLREPSVVPAPADAVSHRIPPGNTASAASVGSPRPFVIELRKAVEGQGGYFVPEAFLIITSVFRTDGLLAALPAEDLSSLLFLLTFLSPNGDIVPTTSQLAQAMGVPERAVRYRMGRLTRFIWHEKPLGIRLERDSGLHAYTISPHLVTIRQAQAENKNSEHITHRTAGREAVIAHSRATYAKPRRYVEDMIARLNNWDVPHGDGESESSDSTIDERRTLQTRLLLAGVSRVQTDSLLAHYPLEQIRDQLQWLPMRQAKSPARFIVAAIEKNFAPPRGLNLPAGDSSIHEAVAILPDTNATTAADTPSTQ